MTELERRDRRGELLAAAVRVFAEKGYHSARVGDIAKEGGVAYGLLYHYFPSKESVLEAIFRDTWARMLDAVSAISSSGAPAADQLRRVAAVVLGSWKANPDLIRVLVREVTRSPQVQREVAEIAQAMHALEEIVRLGQERRELRQDIRPRLAAWIIYGALEEILTGWVLGAPPETDADVAEAVHAATVVLTEGLVED